MNGRLPGHPWSKLRKRITMTRHTRHHCWKTVATLLAAGALGLGLAGCQSGQSNHEKWKQQANNRWHDMRSSLMLDMARQQFEAGDLERAKKSVREALRIDADNPRLLLLAGRIALERSKLERSFHLFERAIEKDKEMPKPHYYKGTVLQRWQQYEQAYQAYKQAYELRSDEVAYLIAQSEMLVQLGRVEAAIKLLEDKRQYFDQNSTLRTALAHLYNMQRRYDKAAALFQEASLLNPDNTQIKQELGLAQLAAGRANEAIHTLESVLSDSSDKPRRADLRRALANAYLQTGRDEKARETYFELARSKAGGASDWVRLAELSWEADEPRATLDAAHRAMATAPDNPKGYLLAGLVFQKQGKLDQALRMFDRAAKAAPDSARPLVLRGLSLQNAGRTAAAAAAYEKALERQPDDDRVQRLLKAVDRTHS
jgi:tetratricopeptide (TPR) repeat protein